MTPRDPAEESVSSLSRALAIVGAGCLALLIFVFFYAPILDQDIWWHLKSGW